MSWTDPAPLRLVLAGAGPGDAALLEDLLEGPLPRPWTVVLALAPAPDDPFLAAAARHGVPVRPLSDPAAAEAVAAAAADLVADLRPDPAPPLPGAHPVAARVAAVLAAVNRARRADRLDLQAARDHLVLFTAAAPFGIYRKDADLRFTAANPAACRLLGCSEGDIRGRANADLLVPPAARRLDDWERQALAGGRPLTFDGVLPLDGEERLYLRVTLLPLLRDGVPQGLIGLVVDTTDLHDSERRLSRQRAELAEMREYLRGILANSQDMIVLTTLDGTIVAFNRGAENVSGYQGDEVMGTRFQSLAVDPDELDTLLAAARRDGHATAEEMRFRHRDGHDFIANVSLTAINSPSGHPIEIVCICRDLTRRLRLQEDLIQSERLAAIGKLAAGVAHEINNPLQIIEMVAGLIDDLVVGAGDRVPPDLRDRIRDGIRRLHRQTERCTTITHSLLSFVRRSQGEPVPVDVRRLLDDTATLLAPELRRLDVAVTFRVDPDLPPLVVDPTLLEQVLVNLIKNAVDAIEERQPPRPRIDLLASLVEHPEGMRVALTVRDNGIGIPPDRLSQVFELFYTSKPAGKGTGLGLSIVRHIVEKLGGVVRVESSPDTGSAFTVILPLQPRPAATSD